MAKKPRKGVNLLDTKTVASIVKDTAKGDLAPNVHADGGSLYLQVTAAGASWLRRFTFAGVRRVIGLGDIDSVSLATAREKSAEVGALVAKGIDPVKHRDALAAQQKAGAALTFQIVGERYYGEHLDEWRGKKTAYLFTHLMGDAYKIIGKLPVSEITMDDALRVLRPIWKTKNCSAKRLMFWARLAIDSTRGEAGGIPVDRLNPFTWKSALKHRLANPAKFAKEQHRVALDWRHMPVFMEQLRATEGDPARMLELCVLCTLRTAPVIQMRWREIDLADATWNVPQEHEKSFEPLRVPLSQRAVAILKARRPANAKPTDLVWPSAVTGRCRAPITLLRVLRRLGYAPDESTVHGFRSVFCDWRAELTHFSVDLQEAALSHAISGVRSAYQRGDLFVRRRALMQAWADYCDGQPSNVVPFRGKAA